MAEIQYNWKDTVSNIFKDTLACVWKDWIYKIYRVAIEGLVPKYVASVLFDQYEAKTLSDRYICSVIFDRYEGEEISSRYYVKFYGEMA